MEENKNNNHGKPRLTRHPERSEKSTRISHSVQHDSLNTPHAHDPYTYTDSLDRSLQAAVGKFTAGISPAALMLAFSDWYIHLAIQPSKQMQLFDLFQQHYWHLYRQLLNHLHGDATGEYVPLTSPQDKRFVAKSWQQFPYTFLYESFLLCESWWKTAATGIHGVSAHHQEVVNFMLRQFLDMLSPSNFIGLNPEVFDAMINTGGDNFIKGMENFVDDVRRTQLNEPPAGADQYIVGENIAITKGTVIYRNRLIELIQYAPQTKQVHANPILITPAWIMKYYILDLAPKHSLVNFLVKNGHTVFMISWKNPKKKDRDLSMDDYLNLGIMRAMEAVAAIVPNEKVHLVGYCLGGTLSAIAAAVMMRDNDKRLATLTLLAAQIDFTEPGELGLFIDNSQIAFLESMMSQKGYLDTTEMAGAFQLLRSNDLIWSRMVRDYLLGERKPLTDLMAWNADATRMPYKMHSEYLRKLFLANELAEGKFKAGDKPVALRDITLPMFVVATERDHVSPWRSVFKVNLLTTGEVTFVLTSGGHNMGIVNIPVKKTKRYYHLSTLRGRERYTDADTWLHETKVHFGSWWPAFEKWLDHYSDRWIDPPTMGNEKAGYLPLESAPGSYVRQK